MPTRRFPAPTSVSRRARTVLNAAPALTARSMELAALNERRRETFALYAPQGEKWLSKLGGRSVHATLGGVRVQVVHPREKRGDDVVLYLFGGGYVQGTPEEDLCVTATIAHETGRVVYAPAYRLAPEHPYPAALEDALNVYRALLASHGAAAITLMGESAGAGLALCLALAASRDALALPAKLVLLSPWSDLSATGDTIATLKGIDPFLDYEVTLEGPACAYAGPRDLKDPLISPLYAEFPANFPKTLITTGTRDLFLSDCARLSTKMRAAGIEAELRVWEGMWHVFEFYIDLPEARASLREIAAFIAG
ncbi:acetyl esterase/lipase [Dongia mobilis]|uniref:Acetyl esterase/lipase n=1 Tax=Dongia mobilis TaxID=578943 RepID=A0A4R6WR07_9PROT|nr:alpha/beta hydrolase fold domain-containing protein [Dongia mobilis]TDQ80854.1 acetyl esterase/lipase [Dongia mobilis]